MFTAPVREGRENEVLVSSETLDSKTPQPRRSNLYRLPVTKVVFPAVPPGEQSRHLLSLLEGEMAESDAQVAEISGSPNPEL